MKTSSNIRVPRFVVVALRAWRGITFRQLIWTTGITLILLLAYLIGVLPPLLSIVRDVTRPSSGTWGVSQSVGVTLIFFAAGTCFLLAVSIVEYGVPRGFPPVRRYVVAGIAACVVAIVVEMTLYVLAPSSGPGTAHWKWPPPTNELLGRIAWSVTNFGLSGGLALAVYVRFRSARRVREAFNSAELERVVASRDVLFSQLTAMRARIDPQFLLGTLAEVNALYDRDPKSGDRMLDALSAYLRAALPHRHIQRSTLQHEADLAESYLKVVQLRLGRRVDYAVDIEPKLGDSEFPPMMLLPLIDDALRNGLEPSPDGGAIRLTAGAHGDHLRVFVSDTGLPRTTPPIKGPTIAALHERLKSLCGEDARLELTNNVPRGIVAMIEVPLESACRHR
jgi:hypothetical protein